MYFLPMYRYENVQKGRQREFNQFGVELLQSPNAIADFEVIKLGMQILIKLGVARENYILKINSIGCENVEQNIK